MIISSQLMSSHDPLDNASIHLAEKDPSLIKAPWLLLVDPDYLFLKPVLAPLAESDEPDLGFVYTYIQPHKHESVIRVMFPASGGPLSNIPSR